MNGAMRRPKIQYYVVQFRALADLLSVGVVGASIESPPAKPAAPPLEHTPLKKRWLAMSSGSGGRDRSLGEISGAL